MCSFEQLYFSIDRIHFIIEWICVKRASLWIVSRILILCAIKVSRIPILRNIYATHPLDIVNCARGRLYVHSPEYKAISPELHNYAARAE